ncbi:DUF4394 domain-containing protein [Kibdelosporangium phytohabitans]|uniref:DUF4394 domain-containing protein n=1 Tax=Kibdelosporangium phytohabitans TaxID=860235 RepID=A0A0N9IAM9_9PSEU|nr:DUF4394 domain-containing protein [Kibdelosporangium phytohabitans]ALG11833.1 hypothetical protein AOZ06_37605 [Kibdelosporangium phytohabitans]MBE1463254.1 hypothetical protein [Kibdelosporangium phytohabitans]
MGSRFSRRIGVAVLTAATATAVAVGVPASSTAGTAPSLQVFGILANGTVMAAFKTNTPQQLDWVRSVSGLTGNDKSLIGIDYRVQDGKLYGVANHGGIYTITLPVKPEDPVRVHKVSQLTVALHGTRFGVDFNPAANRLRVVSDTGQNLRHDTDGGVTAADTNLSATAVTAAAYTNNDLHPDTDTTLFVLNTSTDRAAIQSPANSGQIAPTGKLGPDADTDAGLDIYSDLTGSKTATNTAFGTLVVAGVGRFYAVEVLTGTATEIGAFPLPVTDVAIALDKN